MILLLAWTLGISVFMAFSDNTFKRNDYWGTIVVIMWSTLIKGETDVFKAVYSLLTGPVSLVWNISQKSK